jgi:hypothetical protein
MTPKTTFSEIRKSENVTCGWHQIAGRKVGDLVTVTKYVPAQLGQGMTAKGSVTGTLIMAPVKPTRVSGCSFEWAEVVMQTSHRLATDES